jgi:hypothetical protein
MKKYNKNIPKGGPDAGSWIYDENEKKWIEKPLDIEIDWLTWPVRKADENTTHKFYIDGSYRHATNTLVRIVLDAFPTVAIEIPIAHREFLYDEALSSGTNVIATIRDPFDSVVSCFEYGEYDFSETIEFERDINFYIRIYKKLLSIENKINFIHFNSIIKNPSNILLLIKNHYSIKIDEIYKYENINNTPLYNGTTNREKHIKIASILNDFKKNTNLNEAYCLYEKILKSKNCIDKEFL